MVARFALGAMEVAHQQRRAPVLPAGLTSAVSRLSALWAVGPFVWNVEQVA